MQAWFVLPIRRSAIAAALALGFFSAAHSAVYTTIDADASEITFKYRQMNVVMDGRFTDLKADNFQFDPTQPESAQITLEIPLISIDAGYPDANDELKKSEWLNLAQHPFARFEAHRIEALEENEYEVTGILSIKGVSKEISTPVKFTQEADRARFNGKLSFNRSDFAIGTGAWADTSIVADDIQIQFEIIASP